MTRWCVLQGSVVAVVAIERFTVSGTCLKRISALDFIPLRMFTLRDKAYSDESPPGRGCNILLESGSSCYVPFRGTPIYN